MSIFTRMLKADELMALNPALIGEVGSYKFYEHPIKGDEETLIAVGKGQCGLSVYWDLPTVEELQDADDNH